MDKVHDVQSVAFSGTTMLLCVDGKQYEIDVRKQSNRLAKATPQQRQKFEISPSGYGIHWPDIDEDLSIDGLIGVRHSYPFSESRSQ
jgi:hypothetical protein